MTTRLARSRRVFSGCFAIFAIALAACDGASPSGVAGADRSSAPSVAQAAVVTADGGTCGGTGAHDAHAALGDCQTCHACGGVYAFTPQTFPGGTTTVGGVIDRTTSPTTCSVGCHNPSGSTPGTVSWGTVGPLPCTGCHVLGAPGTVFESAHAVPQTPASADRAGCQGCHDTSTHLSGTVRIQTQDGDSFAADRNDPVALNAACKSCHDGQGALIGGHTPPLLIGFDDAGGEPHGLGVGDGYTTPTGQGAYQFVSPYGPGQPALPCTVCHQAHASTNDFLVRTGAGAPVVTRAGVNAENLCQGCHQPPRHEFCAQCHGVDPIAAGSPCFVCHGHEGTAYFPFPPDDPHNGQPYQRGCDHCHAAPWMPTLEYVPPVITASSIQVEVTSTTATITWTTNELASSFVEWGLGTLNRVSGTADAVFSHSVTLTGLTDATTYTFRVRTSDRLRNVTLSGIQTFETISPDAPSRPTPIAQADYSTCETTQPVVLEWAASTDPNGDALTYDLQLDNSPAFDSPILNLTGLPATTRTATVPSGNPAPYYYWRVAARDSTGLRSAWSAADSFFVYRLRPSYCYE